MRNVLSVVGMAVALAVVGCGSAADEQGADVEAGELSTPLVSITLEGGQTVEFFDMQGVVGVTESAPLGTPSMLVERGLVNATPEQVFQALQPGRPMPAALANVVARIASQPAPVAVQPTAEQLAAQGEAKALAAEELAVSGGENVGQVQQPYKTLSQFVAGGGCETSFANPVLFNTCRSWSGNGYWANWWSKNAFYQAASGAGGAFTMRATLSNHNPLIVEVPMHGWKGVGWLGLAPAGTELNMLEVTGAANDTFRVSSVFYNN